MSSKDKDDKKDVITVGLQTQSGTRVGSVVMILQKSTLYKLLYSIVARGDKQLLCQKNKQLFPHHPLLLRIMQR